ncbi:hypothetical protein [Sphingomonas sp.]|uniref:hypothetical protein n=1 Tax=Sphingomonas sp. TaxID=28214 RepID=UPI003D6D515B
MGQPISGPPDGDSGAVKRLISIGVSESKDDRIEANPRWRFDEERIEQLIQAFSRAIGPIVFFVALGGLIWLAIRFL